MIENKTSGIVPERKDIPDKYKWNLEDIYASFDEWQKSYDSIHERIDALANYAGKLGEGSDVLLAFIKEDESVSLELGKLYSYANMKSHEDLRENKPMEL
ncbi:MAG: oligoendopeptidase F, partial [Synergistaceae bacterium]|nr:oligoendopeptidase F [Synergistaceae bacterium]